MKKIYSIPSAIYVERTCEGKIMGGSIPIKDGEGDFTNRQDFGEFTSTWDDTDSDL